MRKWGNGENGEMGRGRQRKSCFKTSVSREKRLRGPQMVGWPVVRPDGLLVQGLGLKEVAPLTMSKRHGGYAGYRLAGRCSAKIRRDACASSCSSFVSKRPKHIGEGIRHSIGRSLFRCSFNISCPIRRSLEMVLNLPFAKSYFHCFLLFKAP